MTILDDCRQALRRAGGGPRDAAPGRPEKPTNAYALGATGVGPFLLASVGQDANASDLTCLSMLARLGMDPWAEAARLSNASKPAATAELSAAIGRMPLDSSSLRDAEATASRLVALLPGRTPSPTNGGTKPAIGAPSKASVPVALAALALGLLLSNLFFHHHRDAAPATSHATVVHRPN